MTVTVRPWNQNRDTAAGRHQQAREPDAVRARQPGDVQPGPGLALGPAQHAPLTASGSLYGGIQVFAKQRRPKARNGIIPQWDLVGRLRLNPSRKRPNLRVRRRTDVRRQRQRPLADPRGPQHRQHAGPGRRHGPHHGPEPPQRARSPRWASFPGQVVYLKGGALAGLKAGNYTADWSVTQGSKRLHRRRPHVQA